MIDKFHDPLISPRETARYLRISDAMIRSWLTETVIGEPLVHGVRVAPRGGFSLPFAGVVEAYVLRSLLLDMQLGKRLVREVVAASYFGVSGAMSAFTIAFQVPNLVRSLFADAALQRVVRQERDVTVHPLRQARRGRARRLSRDLARDRDRQDGRQCGAET